MTTTTARRFASAAALASALALAGGCSNAGEGLLSGAGIGAVTGLIIGSTMGAPGEGAAIGAALGGASGAVIGDQNERDARNAEREAEYRRGTNHYEDYGYNRPRQNMYETAPRRENVTIYRTYEYDTAPRYRSYRSTRYRSGFGIGFGGGYCW